jgi:hypothetical protein
MARKNDKSNGYLSYPPRSQMRSIDRGLQSSERQLAPTGQRRKGLRVPGERG